MEILKTAADSTAWVLENKSSGKSIGFVPTMGALHPGHLSLIKKSLEENDLTIASIFVNPTQFNDKNDLKKYPRTLEKDCKLLEETGCNVVFSPPEKEIYPNSSTNKSYNLGGLDACMEGVHRPGHFKGVAMVIERLFSIIPANNAYFGLKDFQQFAIIKHITKQLQFDINIKSGPTVREKDGLAMSSRNLLLSAEHRAAAPLIYQILIESKQFYQKNSIEETKKWVINKINKNPLLMVEYYEIVDDITLQPAMNWETDKNIFGCIAVHAGDVRLIDNIQYNS